MADPNTLPFQDLNSLLVPVRQKFNVNNLKSILRGVGFTTTGRKKELQDRIVDGLYQYKDSYDVGGYNYLAALIRRESIAAGYSYFQNPQRSARVGGSPSISIYGQGNISSPNVAPQLAPMAPPAAATAAAAAAVKRSSNSYGHANSTLEIDFRPSPFYTCIERLSYPLICPALPSVDDSVHAHFNLTDDEVHKMTTDKSYRIYVCSGAIDNGSKHTGCLMQFPSQIAFKINGRPTAINVRGLKNKPGTSKPADVTDNIVRSRGLNRIEINYVATPQRYAMVVFLVKTHSVDELVTSILSGPRISTQTTVAQLTKKGNDDDDIVETSRTLSITCPLSFTKIVIPVRSVHCSHVQCYDAKSYLLLQEQAPTWQCPICNHEAPMADLAVDSYVNEILKQTGEEEESVELEPNGIWRSLETGKSGPDYLVAQLEAKNPSRYSNNGVDNSQTEQNIGGLQQANGNGGSRTPTPNSGTGSISKPVIFKREPSEMVDLDPHQPQTTNGSSFNTTNNNNNNSPYVSQSQPVTPDKSRSQYRNGSNGMSNGTVPNLPFQLQQSSSKFPDNSPPAPPPHQELPLSRFELPRLSSSFLSRTSTPVNRDNNNNNNSNTTSIDSGNGPSSVSPIKLVNNKRSFPSDVSNSPSGSHRASPHKRAASAQVIDLTLSDDES